MIRDPRLVIIYPAIISLSCLLSGCGRSEKAENQPTPTPSVRPTSTPAPTPELGVLKTSASGLQYEDLAIGNGPRPLPGQAIQIFYTGRFEDGRIFDSGPFTYKPLSDKTIKGWKFGILGDTDIPPMRVGGRRKIIVPPHLGYGGMTLPQIPANSTLIFELEVRKLIDTDNPFNSVGR